MATRQETHDIRQQAQTPQIPHTRLSRFRLLFTSDDRNQTNVNQRKVLVTDSELELSHGFDERSTLDITDCTTEFDDAHVGDFAGFINGHLGDSADPVLDGVSEVGDHLDGLTKVISSSLGGGKSKQLYFNGLKGEKR